MNPHRLAHAIGLAAAVLAPVTDVAAQPASGVPEAAPGFPVARRTTQTLSNGRSVVGWRLGLLAGGYDVRGGGFTGASTGAGANLGLDFISRSGWGIGVAGHASLQDPLDESFLISTLHASLRYNNVGRGEHYYQFIGLDGVAGWYRWNRASTGTGADTTAMGFGLGPSLGVGGFVGGDGIAMEISVGYAFMWFRDQKVNGSVLAGTSVQTNILRILIGFWIG